MIKSACVCIAVSAALITYNPEQWAQGAPKPLATQQLHGPTVVGAPVHVTVSDIPQMTAEMLRAVRPSPPLRNPNFNDAQWNIVKAAAARTAAVARPNEGGRLLAPVSPFGSDTGFLPQPDGTVDFSDLPTGAAKVETPGASIDFTAGSRCGFVPSDMGVAVNGLWVVQVINACVYVYTKAGVLQSGFPKSLDAVLGWPAGTFTYDPRVTYDYGANRFIISAATYDANNNGWFDIAASDTQDPRAGWHTYHLSGGAALVDFPTLGQNSVRDPFDGAIYTCANIYPNAGGFTNECLYLPKFPIYAGQGFSYYHSSGFSYGGTIVDTIQPANVYEPTEKPRAEFAVNALNTGGGGVCGGKPCNGLVVWAFANTLVKTGSPGPSISGIHVATPSSYTEPASADNAAFCNNCIDTGDNRISGMVHYSAGRLFPSINVGNGGTSAVLGWAVRPFLNDNGGGTCTGAFLNACPTITGATVEQEFCYFCGAGHGGAAFYGAIAPTPENNWTMFATFSSQSRSPGTFYTSNRVTQQTPFHDGGIYSCQTNNAYGSAASPARWGDYSAAAPDLTAASANPTIWGSGMYTASANVFGTCIAANAYTTANQP